MTTKSKAPKSRKTNNDHDPISPFTYPQDDDIAVIKTSTGRALLIPASVRNLTGEAYELVVELQDHAAALHDAQASLDRLIGECREAGVSWTAIGFSVGISSQGARQRWGEKPAPPPPARRRRSVRPAT